MTPPRLRPERLGGVLMLAAVAAALLAANSPLAPVYQAVHHAPVHFRVGPFVTEGPLIEWINRGLMTAFFFLVGLEMKREMLEGCLSSIDRCLLPAIAAFGGMAMPAAIYVALNSDAPEAMRGWAIPVATDIVLAVGVISLLGSRVPVSLRVLLTAIAIFDDIGAVLIIGAFYGDGIELIPLAGAAAALVVLALWNHHRPVGVAPNLIGALLVWLSFHEAGIEPALAGLPLAATIPLRSRAGQRTPSPLVEAERRFKPWVLLLIVPVFAFLNAGVRIDGAAVASLASPMSLGILAGLVIGKPLGIAGAIYLAVRVGISSLPPNLSPRLVLGIAQIAGIGFTMSYFLVTLAFGSAPLGPPARLAVLLGSALSSVIGLAVLWGASASGTGRGAARNGRPS